jgi:hypothetical protein
VLQEEAMKAARVVVRYLKGKLEEQTRRAADRKRLYDGELAEPWLWRWPIAIDLVSSLAMYSRTMGIVVYYGTVRVVVWYLKGQLDEQTRRATDRKQLYDGECQPLWQG